MDEIRYRSYLGNDFIARFDGEVLEIFGPTGDSGASPESRRFHRDLMTITMDQPDRKGLLEVDIYAGPAVSRGVPSCRVRITQQDQHVIDFFGRVHAATPHADAGV